MYIEDFSLTIIFSLVTFGLLFVFFKLVVSKLVKNNQLQSAALDGVSDHVVITDLDGKILYVNRAAEKLTGYSRSEVIGNTRASLWGRKMTKEYYERLWKTIKEEKRVFEDQITNVRKNGEEYEASIKISPILDKKERLRFFVGIERDITQEKEIDKAKTEFISLVSHQLRTPITTIKWYSEMLTTGDVGALNAEQREYISEIYHGSTHLSEIINGLLTVSRLELGTFIASPKPTDILSIVSGIVEELQPMISLNKIKLFERCADDLPRINLDPKLLHIVFQNLLTNAVKYTPQGGQVTIEVFLADDKGQMSGSGSQLLIKVSDTGFGIPESQKDKIFTRLFRADNARERQPEGTGLGLYIVKKIVDHSGGRVWFESKENEGTTFYITLPL